MNRTLFPRSRRLVTTVTLNPTIDHFYSVDVLHPRQVQVAKSHLIFSSGKGVNVGRCLSVLGRPSVCTGFLGAGDAAEFVRGLKDIPGLKTEFVTAPGLTRRCVLINEIKAGADTVVNLRSPFTVNPMRVRRLQAILKRLARKSAVTTFCGSLAEGMTPAEFAGLVRTVQREGSLAFVDNRRAPLLAAMAFRPFLVKMNMAEYVQTFGRVSGPSEACRRLIRRGAGAAIISLGERGSVGVMNGESWRAFLCQKVRPVSPTGCGDAYTAGFCHAFLNGQPFPECLRLATATAVSNLLNPGTGFILKAQVHRLLRRVRVERVR